MIKTMNEKALEKVCLAQPILDELKLNPTLTYSHNPKLLRLGISRWRGEFVKDTVDEIQKIYGIYGAGAYDNENCKREIPEEVRVFVTGATKFIYRDLREDRNK